MKKLKINYLNNRKLSNRDLNKIRGGKLCLCSCQLGADQAVGDKYAHDRLNPPSVE